MFLYVIPDFEERSSHGTTGEKTRIHYLLVRIGCASPHVGISCSLMRPFSTSPPLAQTIHCYILTIARIQGTATRIVYKKYGALRPYGSKLKTANMLSQKCGHGIGEVILYQCLVTWNLAALSSRAEARRHFVTLGRRLTNCRKNLGTSKATDHLGVECGDHRV
ncbi:hypothetical protein Salat_1875200 [Sesamum alatum]|uniref:Uncharacterized protein n=1 Tax=Sesamum alatum TaxID=300844 RepID=A0AAE1Y4A5_9LAMI|nr:hypothetical protein Salat_1875200 [Sesamum alatum]